jgi:hypothetical protein
LPCECSPSASNTEKPPLGVSARTLPEPEACVNYSVVKITAVTNARPGDGRFKCADYLSSSF